MTGRNLTTEEGEALYAVGGGLKEKIHVFQELDVSEMAVVEGLLKTRNFGPNETIYREGEKGDSLNVIMKGKAKINKTMVEGGQFCIAILKEGDIFGIMSFLDGSSHDATIVSDQQTQLIVLKKPDFENLFLTSPLIAGKILRGLAVHLASILRNMNSQYIDLTHLMFRKSRC
ncbi:MAG TPA: cyclic nucleotide-binding domain-containing protein [Thermodesulfovibrionales bacterium]|nr:cyclic nucleotide-binding domain-containing protein [Thermodesulfovibrionales bacterium]